ncbi:MAG: AAA family ATPase [Chloroflexi bacterium]|nr:AAA family ATPase [Chloroflexota bacterium]
MPHLSLSLLGGFQVRLNGEQLTAFGSDKVRALLAFLAVESARPHRRAELGAMLWHNLPEKKAAHNLSQTLLRLRNALREQASARRSSRQPFLLITNQDVQFNPLSDYKLDVALFDQLLQAHRQHQHQNAATCAVCMQWLHQATNLYRGDLLAGFFVRDSLGFEEWRLARQEALHRQMLEALAQLTADHERRGEYEQVKNYARRQVTLEPWGEQAYLQLMRALVRTGQPAAALEQYETYRNILAAELEIEPSAEATALYAEIKGAESTRPGNKETRQSDGDPLGAQGERRQVTVVVCGHANVDIRRDPETLHEHLSFCRHHCESTLSRFGGYRMRRQGDKCLILFGYPQALEDAPRRAVDAGLAMAKTLEGNRAVSIGIHTDVMIVGERRGQRLEDRDLFGDAPNRARACQSQAEPGAVLITEEAARLVRGWFDYEPLEIQGAAGLSQPTQVYLVRGRSGAQSRLEWLAQTRCLTAFIGREPELDQLMACRNQARRGHGQIVLVSGEPGIGKSRLLFELKARFLEQHPDRQTISAQGTPIWVESRCSPYFQNTSLYPIITLLEQMLGFETDDSLEVKHDKLSLTLARYDLVSSAEWLLSLLLGLPTNPPAPQTITAAQRERMREIFVALLKKQSATFPLVLVIEDLHWSDPSTIEWLNHTFDSLAAIPCFALLTFRPSFAPPWLPREHLVRLALGPLNANQTMQMVSSLIGDASSLRDEVRQRIVTQTDGIPLFVEELTEALIEDQNLKVALPATLRDSLMARLDHVGAAKETALWAATLGRDFSYPVLHAVAPFDERRLQSDLARLIDAGLVYPQNQVAYSFKHGLVQEAAYASLLTRTRQDYHRRIAETLETRFPKTAETQPEVLAHHYANAGLPTQAIDYWLRAGEQATEHGATQEAKVFFDRALEQIEPTDRERRWRALYGRETVLNLREVRAAQKKDIEALLELADACENDDWRAQAFRRQAQYAARMNDHQLMLRASEAAIVAAVRAGDHVIEVQMLSGKAQALTRLKQWNAAREAVEDTLAKLPGVADEGVQAGVLVGIAVYFADAGDLSRALLFMQQSRETVRRMGDRYRESRFNVNVGILSAQLGDWADARAAFEEGLALAESLGDLASQTTYRYNLSHVYWQSGDRDRARAIGEQALLELRTTGYRTHSLAVCLTHLGFILEDAGDYAAAAAYLAEARAVYASVGAKPRGTNVQAVEARCMLKQGQREQAQQLAAEVWAYLRERGSDRVDNPSRAYLCVADVASVIEIPGLSPREVIEAGYRDLMQRAEKISDAEWRQSFLENVNENRAIMERWKKMQ